MPKFTIYRHIHDESGRSYVGQTQKTMLKRWNQHVYMSNRVTGKGRSHFCNAIRAHGNGAFSHEVLEICDSLERANEREQFWIWVYDARNPIRGFNLALGGDHVPHPIRRNPWNRPEFRAGQMALLPPRLAMLNNPAVRARNKASLNTPESKAKRTAISKEILNRPEIKVKTSAAAKIRSEAQKAQIRLISKSALGTTCSEETKSKIRVSVMNRDPSYKAKIIASNTGRKLNPETRAKIGAAAKGKKMSNETKMKISAANVGKTVSQDVRRRISESMKAYLDKRT